MLCLGRVGNVYGRCEEAVNASVALLWRAVKEMELRTCVCFLVMFVCGVAEYRQLHRYGKQVPRGRDGRMVGGIHSEKGEKG